MRYGVRTSSHPAIFLHLKMSATSHQTTSGLSSTPATTAMAIGMRCRVFIVNKLGYVMTREAWSDSTPDAIYFLDDFEHEPDA